MKDYLADPKVGEENSPTHKRGMRRIFRRSRKVAVAGLSYIGEGFVMEMVTRKMTVRELTVG